MLSELECVSCAVLVPVAEDGSVPTECATCRGATLREVCARADADTFRASFASFDEATPEPGRRPLLVTNRLDETEANSSWPAHLWMVRAVYPPAPARGELDWRAFTEAMLPLRNLSHWRYA